MVPQGAPTLSRRFQQLSAEGDQLRADVAQLRLQAACASIRPSGRLEPQGRGTWNTVGPFVSAGTWKQHEAPIPDICTVGHLAVACAWDGWLSTFDLSEAWRVGPSHHLQAKTAGVSATPGTSGGGGARLQAVAASRHANETIVLTGAADSRAWLWSVGSQETQELSGHEGGINAVTCHPKRSEVACTAGDDCKAVIWDTSGGKQVRVLKQHLGSVTSCFLLGAPGGAGAAHDRTLLTGSVDGHVRCWDLRAPALLYALPATAGRRLMLDASAAGQLVLAASDLGLVSAWDLRTLRRLQHLDLQSQAEVASELTSLALSPCCQHLAVGTLDGSLACVDLRSSPDLLYRGAERGSSIEVRRVHDDAIFGLAWGSSWAHSWPTEASPFLVCSSHDHRWSCWNLGNEEAWNASSGPIGSTPKAWLDKASSAGGR